MVGVAQCVQQLLFVVLPAALPAGGTFFQFEAERGWVEALLQQAFIGQLVDHARVAHQVLHRPARHAQKAQQPAVHFGPLDQQCEVVFAPQQRLQPIDKTQRCGFGATAVLDGPAGALHQAAQAQPAFIAQLLHAGMLHPDAQTVAQCSGQAVEQAVAVHRLWRRAAGAASVFAVLAAGAVQAARRAIGRPPFAQQRVKFCRHQFAHFAQTVQQRAGIGLARQGQALRNPAQVFVVARQQVRLLVVEELDAVFHLAQEGVGCAQLVCRVGLHQPA